MQTVCTSEQDTAISEMKASSFSNDNQILDTKICIEDIEGPLRILKMEKSSGPDGILPEHMGVMCSKCGSRKFSIIF